jgi:hypothetical protein
MIFKKLIDFEIIILGKKGGGNILQNSIFSFTIFVVVLLGKKSVFENFNIFENNIISVEAAKVVSSRVVPWPNII